MTFAIVSMLVVIVLVGVDITVHVAKRPPRSERDDGKIIVDLTKRK